MLSCVDSIGQRSEKVQVPSGTSRRDVSSWLLVVCRSCRGGLVRLRLQLRLRVEMLCTWIGRGGLI